MDSHVDTEVMRNTATRFDDLAERIVAQRHRLAAVYAEIRAASGTDRGGLRFAKSMEDASHANARMLEGMTAAARQTGAGVRGLATVAEAVENRNARLGVDLGALVSAGDVDTGSAPVARPRPAQTGHTTGGRH